MPWSRCIAWDGSHDRMTVSRIPYRDRALREQPQQVDVAKASCFIFFSPQSFWRRAGGGDFWRDSSSAFSLCKNSFLPHYHFWMSGWMKNTCILTPSNYPLKHVPHHNLSLNLVGYHLKPTNQKKLWRLSLKCKWHFLITIIATVTCLHTCEMVIVIGAF